MNKNILVLLKLYKGDTNPFDECALECALSFNDSHVTVLAMAPLPCKESLENITRLGADAILISDPLYAGSDTVATSKVLARAISQIKPDLIFAGRESVDGNTAQVPAMLSELTGYDLVEKVMDIDESKVALRNGQVKEIKDKQILTFEKFKLLRAPSIFSKKREVKIIDNSVLQLKEDEVGLDGSPTRVIKSYSNESGRRFCEFINYQDLDDVVSRSLQKKSEVKEEKINKVPFIHFVGNLAKIAAKYAQNVEKIEVDGLSIDEIVKKIESIKPEIILWEENEKYKPLAARVAIKMNYGLCADCVSFNYVDKQFIITRPALGGDVIANIISNSKVKMATIKAETNNEEGVAITVGRGVLPYLDKVEKLAKKYNAQIYCSRPLADNGNFDYKKQVGLTGITIAPKVCITIGTSGAVQHIVGIDRSQTIIAININKREKIFDYANYGIVMDIKEL